MKEPYTVRVLQYDWECDNDFIVEYASFETLEHALAFFNEQSRKRLDCLIELNRYPLATSDNAKESTS